MSSDLRMSLLGAPRLFLDGKRLTGFKSVKVKAILFYAAVTQSTHSRPMLAAMLWPQASEKQANMSLRTALSNLRQLVGEHLEINRQSVALNPDNTFWLDVTQFETLLKLKNRKGESLDVLEVETAVSLYGGDFLEGFLLPYTPLFEQWLTTERERLREALLNALQTLAAWHADRSEYEASLDYLTRLLALDPIREVGHRLKMVVLAMSGQRAAALIQFDSCRRILFEELGVDPSPETVALYELIQQGEFPDTGQPATSILKRGGGFRLKDLLVSRRLERPTLSDRSSPGGMQIIIDWGDIPAAADFFGRQKELAQLVRCLTVEGCRLVAILGMGGMGKTTLAAELIRRLVQKPASVEAYSVNHLKVETDHASGIDKYPDKPPFERIIWRSLVNAPPLAIILDDWLQVISERQLSTLPDDLDARLALFFQELKRRQCLLVLDNAESIMEEGIRAGQPKPGYEEYFQLIQQMVGGEHRSCLLLTTREEPMGLRRLTEDFPQVRLFQLDGLPATTGADLLQTRGLEGPLSRLKLLVERYSGNPLALKLVADTVHDLFAGNLEEFFKDDALIFHDIRSVLDQQFGRLSKLEQEILTWLAIEREPVSVQELQDDIAHKPHRRQFLEALLSLQHRSLLEQSDAGGEPRWGLQNVVMEYTTSRFVESFCLAFESGELEMLQRHALVKAHTKEYVEDSQQRLLLRPVVEWLTARLGMVGAVNRLRDLLETLHHRAPRAPGYAGANFLHLLLEMGVDLSGYDFSQLTMWQVDLRDTSLLDVSFRESDLKGSLFRDTFNLVISIAISPDGQLLAAGTSDGSVMLWEMPKYQPIHILKEHTRAVNSVAFSQDGQILASGSMDHTIRLWDVRSGLPLHQLTGHVASVFEVAFSSDGETLVSGSEDKTIGIWDVQSGLNQRQLREQGDTFQAVAISPDGLSLAGGGHDGMVYVWDVRAGKLRYKIRGHEKKIQTVAFAPNGAAVATGGEDNQIHLWHINDGAKRGSLIGHTNWVLSIAISPNGRMLASGSADKTIRLWDIPSGRTVRVLRGYENWVTSVAFSPDGELVAGGSYDRRIRLWDVRSGCLLHTLRGSLRLVNEVIFSPDGRMLASASFDKPVLLWDVQAGQLLQTMHGHSGSVRGLAFSPDGQTLAGGTDDHTVRLWDTQSGNLRSTLPDHGGFVRTLAFSPDGQTLATGGVEFLRVWEASTGRPRYSLPKVRMGVKSSISFSPDGRLLAYGSTDNTIRLIVATTGHLRATLLGHQAPIQLVRFSPDSSLLASRAKDGAIRIWKVIANDADVKTRDYLLLSTTTEDLWNLAFSPNGRLVAAQFEEGTVGVWDLNDGRLCYSFREHLFGEGCLDFSQNGAFLIAGSSDGNVRLWDAASGELYRTLEGHLESVMSITVDPNGDYIASGSTDGTIRVWDIQNGLCVRIMIPPGPYTGMDITGATGLTPAQAAALHTLGAVSD